MDPKTYLCIQFRTYCTAFYSVLTQFDSIPTAFDSALTEFNSGPTAFDAGPTAFDSVPLHSIQYILLIQTNQCMCMNTIQICYCTHPLYWQCHVTGCHDNRFYLLPPQKPQLFISCLNKLPI